MAFAIALPACASGVRPPDAPTTTKSDNVWPTDAELRAQSREAERTCAATEAAATDAELNVNSIPPSTFVLDHGSPMSTPQSGLRVSAGSHEVVFSNEGRTMVARVTICPGEMRSVGVRF
jgi:hypothetical protein